MDPKGPGGKKTAIEGLKDSLYSRARAPKLLAEERTPLEGGDGIKPPVAWEDTTRPQLEPDNTVHAPEPVKKGLGFAGKFFIASVLFFLVAAAIAAYMVLIGSTGISPQNIDIQVVAPSIIDGGKEAALEVIVNNRNAEPLKLVDLSIAYPDGTRSADDQSQPLSNERQTIGTINPGEQVRRTANAVFYGQEGSTQKVVVTLDYSIQGSNSIFQKTAEADFTLGSAPVSISIQGPKEILATQDFGMDITVTSNSPKPLDNLVLQGSYPSGFTVEQTDPQAVAGGTFWRLGTMNPGDSKTVHLTGVVNGNDGDQKVFRFSSGVDPDETDTSLKVPLIDVPVTLALKAPFITASIDIAGKTGKSISIGNGRITGTVHWKNNLSVPIDNLALKLTLSGDMLDPNTINTDGFYQSLDNTITWTKDTHKELAQVAPGQSGAYTFSFVTLDPSKAAGLTNPTIGLSLGASGVREGQSDVPDTVVNATSMTLNLASKVAVEAQSLHFAGPYENRGPMPPVAGQPTTYTVELSVTNSANTIANATVSTILPSYVDFVATENGSDIIYDKPTRTVKWNLGDLKAGTGFGLPKRTSSFQVVLLPSASQINQSPALTGEIDLNGTDRFAQVPVNAHADAVSTILTGDPQYGRGMDVVQPNK